MIEGSTTALIGLSMFFLPEVTVALAAGLFALVLLAHGGLGIAQSLVSEVPGRVRLLHATLGAVSLCLGVLILGFPPQSVVVLSMLIGLYWLMGGVVQLAAGEDLLPATFSLLGAVVLLSVPAVSPAFLAGMCGLCLTAWGVATVAGTLLRTRPKGLLRRG